MHSVAVQLYVGRDAAIADSLLDRAMAAGIRTLVLTVDANFTARRLRDRRNRFALPLRPAPRLLADLLAHPGWPLSPRAAGADFVLLGRTFLCGTGALGAERGPATTIDILRGELDTAMAQQGCSTLSELRSDSFFTPLPASTGAPKGPP